MEILPELIDLEKALKAIGINREQLIIIGLLCGTDYNPKGIEGIGPHKALKLVKEHKTLGGVLKNVEWNFDVSAKDIFNFFMKPPITDKYSLKEGKINKDKIMKILVKKHDFSSERVENVFKKLDELEQKKKQTSLGKWG